MYGCAELCIYAHTVCLQLTREVFMRRQMGDYAGYVLIAATVAVAGCDNQRLSVSAGVLTGPAIAGSQVTFVPSAIRPEFLSNPFCTSRPFQTQFGLVVQADRELFFNAFRFEFLDRFGGRSVPTSVATTAAGNPFIPSPLPSSSPIPVPGTSPIPTPGTSPVSIPGTSPFDGLFLPVGSSRTLPFVVQFGCGISAPGTLFVDVHTADRWGAAAVTRVSVGVVGG
jgi:hypothetical protein